MNMNYNYDEENNIHKYTHKIMTHIVSEQEKETKKAIEEYCENNNIIPNIISKEKLDLVLKLGINELNKRELENKEEVEII